MIDYRDSMKSKLASLDRKRERLMTALSELDEIDSEAHPEKIDDSPPPASNGTLIDGVFRILSERSMATNEIYTRITLERETSRATVSTALNRLHKRGRISKEGKLWVVSERYNGKSLEDLTRPSGR